MSDKIKSQILNNIWVINLDKSKDRLEKISNNLKSLGLKYNRFSAINGKNITEEKIKQITNIYCKTLLCNYGIVGCASSHIELWKKLVNSNSEYYVILEDDVLLNKTSVDIIKKLENKLSEYNIDWLSLYCVNIGCGISKNEFEIDEYKFGKPFFPLQTAAYILTKNGAKQLLKNIDKISYHIDFDIAIKNFYIEFNYYTSDKPIVQSSEDETTIGNKNESIITSMLNRLGLNYHAWLINVPIFTINFFYEINVHLLILLILLIANKYKIKSDILFWFLILELVIINLIYF
jgi:glycosyl transferase family 25